MKAKQSKKDKESAMENYLVSHGILTKKSSQESKSAQVLLSIQPDLFELKQKQPSKYVDYLWHKAIEDPRLERDVRGKFFELLIACCLIRNEIVPFFWQAQLEFVPLANFDLVIYTVERGPIVLSLKTSIRERYKQAEFEAQAMKDVHRRAMNFLITMDKDESTALQNNIDSGILTGIDGVAVANESSFDEIINFLKTLTIVDTPVFSAVKNPQKIEYKGNSLIRN
jgi:hypothetical protein